VVSEAHDAALSDRLRSALRFYHPPAQPTQGVLTRGTLQLRAREIPCNDLSDLPRLCARLPREFSRD